MCYVRVYEHTLFHPSQNITSVGAEEYKTIKGMIDVARSTEDEFVKFLHLFTYSLLTALSQFANFLPVT